jgi:YbgC/YbaW family acyl-CoA thioester hydrolase
MHFSIKRTILFGDCDPAGIVYTPRVAYFVTEAAHDFLTHLLGEPAVRALFAMGILPPARALTIDYLAPMTWDDVIEIEVSNKPPKTSSFTFVVIGRNATSTVTFRASLTQVCISPENKRPITMPTALRNALSAIICSQNQYARIHD